MRSPNASSEAAPPRPAWPGALFMILVLAGALALGLAWAASGPGAGLDGLFLDRAAAGLGRPRPLRDPVVVLITEKDYASAATPLALWGLHLTPFLEKMKTAAPLAVGLDLLLPRFALAPWLEGHDAKLFRALKQLAGSCRVVAGYGITPQGALEEPYHVYRRILGPQGLGYFNLDQDPDGVVRRQTQALTPASGPPLYSFAALLAGRQPPPGSQVMPDWRSPARLTTLDFAAALQAPAATFQGRIVLLGADFTFQDRHRTPAAPAGEPGVLVQARMVEALAGGPNLQNPGWLAARLWLALAALVLLLGLTTNASQPRVVLVWLLLMLATVGAALLALAQGLVLYPAAAVAGLTLAAAARVAQGYFRLAAERKESFDSFIRSLSAAVDARHHLTAGHSWRVTQYTQIIGRTLGLKRSQLEPLKYAALLHDIGKLGVPDAVLLKDGRFTDQERAIMNQHTAQTREILRHIYFPRSLRSVPELAAAHHEKLNGSGYHQGLANQDIPLASRIMAVADVFDALTSPRDYPKYDGEKAMSRAPMPLAKAVSIIRGEAGTAFDPQVVAAFDRCLVQLLESQRGGHFPLEYLEAFYNANRQAS